MKNRLAAIVARLYRTQVSRLFPSRDLALTAIGLLLLDSAWADARALPEEAYQPANPEPSRPADEPPQEPQEPQDAVPSDAAALSADPLGLFMLVEQIDKQADVPQEEVTGGSIADAKIGAQAGATGAAAAGLPFNPVLLAPLALLGLGGGGGGGGGGGTPPAPVNNAPVFSSGSSGSVNENAKVETVIYQATATDAEGSAIVYSLGGADSALLNIDPKTGAVTLKAPADFETKPSYSFQVIATDGSLNTPRDVTVKVVDLTEKTIIVIDGPLQNAKVYYDADQDGSADEGEYLGLTDKDGALNVSYQSVAGAKFLVVSDAQTIDAFTGNKFTLILEANDGAGNLVVSPLSTLIASGKVTEAALLKALDLVLPAGETLGSFNFVDAIKSGTADAATLAVAKKMAAAAISISNVIEASLGAAKQAGVSASAAMTQAFNTTAQVIAALPAGTSIADVTRIATSLSLAATLESSFKVDEVIANATQGGATLGIEAVNAALPSTLSVSITERADKLAETNGLIEARLESATDSASLTALLSAGGAIDQLEDAAEQASNIPVNHAPTTSLVTLEAIAEDSGARKITQAELVGNAADVDNNTLVASALTITTGKGQLVDNGNGSWTYQPAANDDTAVSFSYTITDNGTPNGAVAGSATLDLTAVNDAPSGQSATLTVLEDGSKTFAASDFGFADASDSPANSLQAVLITTLPTAGTFTFNGSPVTLNQSIAAPDIGKLVFTPLANANGAGYASIGFKVQDSGGTANDGADTSAEATLTIDVTAVNDAPSAKSQALTLSEDGNKAFAASDFGFADASGESDTLQVVLITTLPTAGTLKLNGSPVTLNQAIAVADLGQLVYAPAANANGAGYASIGFKVQDSGGTANGGADTSAEATLTIDVTPINDAPRGTTATLTVLEDGSKTFAASDFGFADASDILANSLQAVLITTLPTAGTLKLDGVDVTVNQSIAATDIGKLVFTPMANANGTGYASIGFKVQDSGGTANGGIDTSAAATLTINVTAVNDAPRGKTATLTLLEDGSKTFAASDFGFVDASGESDTLKSVLITTLPQAGTLTLDDVAVTVNQSIAVADIGKLVFTPVANANGAGYASIGFKVQDSGGTANGGLDTSAEATLKFNVTAVNDDFSDASETPSVLEDSLASSGNLLTGTSSGDGPVTIKGFSLAGEAEGSIFTLGTTYTVAGKGMITVSANGDYSFTPAANYHGSFPLVSYTVTDGSGTDVSSTLQLGVTSVNDAPRGTTATRTMDEDGSRTFSAADFGFADVSDSPANSLQAVLISTLPTAGTLTFHGDPVTPNQTIALDEIDYLVFTPVANANGAGYAKIGFKVQDNGGTANGGIDTSPEATLTINVTAINDDFTDLSEIRSVLEDVTTSGSLFTGTSSVDGPVTIKDFSIADEAEGSTFTLGTAYTVASKGKITVNADGSYSFTPVANYNGAFPVVSYTVTDGSGTDVSSTLTVSITAVNDAPSGQSAMLTVLEDGSKIFAASDFGFADAGGESHMLKSVLITTLPTAGTLTFNSVAVTKDQVIAVADLGQLVYAPAANANGAGYASIGFKVQDSGGTAHAGIDTSAEATLTIDVTAVNDAPSGQSATLTVLEDGSKTFAASDFGLVDASGESDTLQAVLITTLPTAGTLTFNSVVVTKDQVIAVADLGQLVFTPATNINGAGYASIGFKVQDSGGMANGGADTSAEAVLTINVTAVNDAPSGQSATLTVLEDGSKTFAASDFGLVDASGESDTLQAVLITTLPTAGTLTFNSVAVTKDQLIAAADLGKLVFTPAANANGAGYASIGFKVQDSGGTANGGIDTSAEATLTINVTAVNDAPSGQSATLTMLEDGSKTFAASDFGLVDASGESDTLQGVLITTLPTAGTLKLDGVDVTINQSITVADLSKLVYAPAANANGAGYASIGFKVQDSGGTANGGADTSAEATLTINVTAVNDAPSGQSATLTMLEDGSRTFSVADFGFADASGERDTLQAVLITTLPTAGTLKLSGSPVTLDQAIVAADLGKLVYAPAANANGVGYASFGFKVQDSGGTANGGIDTSAAATLTVNVTAVNDAPSGQSVTLTVLEDSSKTFSAADFGFADASGETDTLKSVLITTLPTAGTFTFNGSPVTLNQSIAAPDIGQLVFTPVANANGLGYASIGFKVQDSGGLANGGVDTSAAATLTINVTAVNEAPSGQSATSLLFEDGSKTFAASDFGFADASGESDTLKSVLITTLPTAGTLKLNGSPVTLNQAIAAADLGKLVYAPAANANGLGYASIGFKVQDSGGTANGGIDTSAAATLTINVTAVNDAPHGTTATLTVLEDGSRTFSAADFGFVDASGENHALQSVLITTLPTAGTLKLYGDPVTLNQSIAPGDIGNLVFTPVADANGAGYATIGFKVQDNGGTANGGADTSAEATLTIDVTPVNDDFTDVSETRSVLEDVTISNNLLTGTSSVDGPVTIKDFSIVGEAAGSVFTVGTAYTVAGKGTITVKADGSYSFVPAANYNGSFPVVRYTVTDGSGTDVSSTLTVSITAVNDAPRGTTATRIVLEDGSKTFSAADFGFADASDSPANSLQSVLITTLPTVGTLKLYGDLVTLNQSIAPGDIGNLVFTPVADANGAGYATIGFKVQDNGGTANGGADTSAEATLTIDVTPVNDDFTDVSETRSVLEDSTTSNNLLTGTSSVDGPVTIKDFSIAGEAPGSVFTLGTAYTVVGKGTIIINDDGRYSFTPAANYHGSFPVVSYIVTDGSGTDVSSTLTVSVTAVNDAPRGTTATLTIPEDGSKTFAASDFGFVDASGESDTLKSVLITTLPLAGTLKLDGVAVTVNQSIAAADIGKLVFTPVANANGAGYASIGFKVQDSGGTANGGADTSAAATLTINVTAVNDDFSDSSETRSVLEDGTLSASPLAGLLAGTSSVDGPVTIKGFSIAGEATGSVFTLGTAYTVAGKGQIIINADGSYSFTPAANYNGAFPVVSYTVTDGSGTDASSTLTVSVTPVNDAPTVTPITSSKTQSDETYMLDLLTGASDIDGDGLTVSGASYQINGVTSATTPAGLSLSGNQLQVNPAAYQQYDKGEQAVITVSYQVSDGTLTTQNQATITINGEDEVLVASSSPLDKSLKELRPLGVDNVLLTGVAATHGLTLSLGTGSALVAGDLPLFGIDGNSDGALTGSEIGTGDVALMVADADQLGEAATLASALNTAGVDAVRMDLANDVLDMNIDYNAELSALLTSASMSDLTALHSAGLVTQIDLGGALESGEVTLSDAQAQQLIGAGLEFAAVDVIALNAQGTHLSTSLKDLQKLGVDNVVLADSTVHSLTLDLGTGTALSATGLPLFGDTDKSGQLSAAEDLALDVTLAVASQSDLQSLQGVAGALVAAGIDHLAVDQSQLGDLASDAAVSALINAGLNFDVRVDGTVAAAQARLEVVADILKDGADLLPDSLAGVDLAAMTNTLKASGIHSIDLQATASVTIGDGLAAALHAAGLLTALPLAEVWLDTSAAQLQTSLKAMADLGVDKVTSTSDVVVELGTDDLGELSTLLQSFVKEDGTAATKSLFNHLAQLDVGIVDEAVLDQALSDVALQLHDLGISKVVAQVDVLGQNQSFEWTFDDTSHDWMKKTT